MCVVIREDNGTVAFENVLKAMEVPYKALKIARGRTQFELPEASREDAEALVGIADDAWSAE